MPKIYPALSGAKRFLINAKGILFTLVILAAVIGFFIRGTDEASAKADSSAAAALESAIRRAAVQCFAIEGFYPPCVSYLENHYGVIIDNSRFIAEYICVMSNSVPIISVLYLRNGEFVRVE
jgi:hypothetical protein